MRKEIQILSNKLVQANSGWHRELKLCEAEVLAKIILGVITVDKLKGKKTQQFYARTLSRLAPLITD